MPIPAPVTVVSRKTSCVSPLLSGSSGPAHAARRADRIGISWMPKLLPQIVAVDRALERVSGGGLSLLDVAGLPNLVLTTTGRKSGEPRRTPLLCVPTPDRGADRRLVLRRPEGTAGGSPTSKRTRR